MPRHIDPPPEAATWDMAEREEYSRVALEVWQDIRSGNMTDAAVAWIPYRSHREWFGPRQTLTSQQVLENSWQVEAHERGQPGWPTTLQNRRQLLRVAPSAPAAPTIPLTNEERITRFPAAAGAFEGCECNVCETARRRVPRVVARTSRQEAHRAEYQESGRTFGVEIECLVPVPQPGTSAHEAVSVNGWDRWLADSIRAGSGVNCRRGNFDRDTRSWGVKHDGSLRQNDGRKRSPNGDFLVEIVSPPLRGEAGIASVKSVMRKLVRMDAQVNVSCGFHLHVGAQDLTVEEVANVYSHFVRYERFFDLILPVSRRTNAYAHSVTNAITNGYVNGDQGAQHAILAVRNAKTAQDIERLLTMQGQLDSHWPKLASYGGRGSMQKYGTMEFRQHSGTVNETKAENWIRLCLAFFEKAYTKPANPFLRKTLSPGMEMASFFATFQPPRSVRAFYRERHAKLYADPTNDD